MKRHPLPIFLGGVLGSVRRPGSYVCHAILNVRSASTGLPLLTDMNYTENSFERGGIARLSVIGKLLSPQNYRVFVRINVLRIASSKFLLNAETWE